MPPSMQLLHLPHEEEDEEVRRRISDSSSSNDDEANDNKNKDKTTTATTTTVKRKRTTLCSTTTTTSQTTTSQTATHCPHHDSRLSNKKPKRSHHHHRHRRRVRFVTPLVEKVHPYPSVHLDVDSEQQGDVSQYQPLDPIVQDAWEDQYFPSTSSSSSSSSPSLWYTHAELVAMKRVAKRSCISRRDLEDALNDAYLLSPDYFEKDASPPLALPALSHPYCSPQQLCDREQAPAVSDDSEPTSSSSTGSSTTPNDDDDSSFTVAERALLNIPFFGEQRGMERWSSQRHALSRCLTMLQAKTEVLVTQAQQSSRSNRDVFHRTMITSHHRHHQHHHHPHIRQQDQHALEIAHVCAQASAPAVRFARLLGHFDAKVAREQQQGEELWRKHDNGNDQGN